MKQGRPSRKTHHLRRGRYSLPGARYFITCTTKFRKRSLTDPALANGLLAGFDDLPISDAQMLCATIMPDHVHVMFFLGERLTLGQVVGKWKAKTRKALESNSLHWQDDFFDHRLRPEEESEGFGRYIFLNPYRASLITPNEKWLWWRCWEPSRFPFLKALVQGEFPDPRWLNEPPPWETKPPKT